MSLPSAYSEVKGFTMNNNCYFTITNFKMQGSDTLRFSFAATDACNVIGCYTNGTATTNYSMYVGTTDSAKYLRYNGGTYSSYIVSGKRYDVKITPTGSVGVESPETWTAKTFTAVSDLCVGTTSTGATSAKLIGSLYGPIIVDGRLRLIPCKRTSDNKLGYYDTVGGTFYAPATGTPTAIS